MSDRTGTLRFKNFEIVDTPEAAETAEKIRDYLVGRPLADVEAGRIREIGRDGHLLCAHVVAQLVTESQDVFVRGKAASGIDRLEGTAYREAT